jgi:cation diffusion facilitator CzcD-associated flavoprotein CzcO
VIDNPGGSDESHGSRSNCDVAIIGAGPYGLATRAAPRASDLDIRVFGPPMSFWRERMPAGMLIRSPWVASNFAAPGSGLTLDDYERASGQTLVRPRRFGDTSVSRLGLDDFVAYGEWFQRRTTPDLDERRSRISFMLSAGARGVGPMKRRSR